MLNTILLIVFFAVITGCVMLFFRLTLLSTEESIVASIASIITLLFISGLLGNLHIAVIPIYVLSAAGWVFFFFGERLFPNLINKKSENLISFFSPGYVLFCIVFIYGIFAYANVHLYAWDEYGTWGLVVKHMWSTNSFGTVASGYLGGNELNPPGTSVFHYFMVKTTGFVEGNMYNSNMLLIFAGFLLPTTNLTWKNWKKAFLYGIFMFIALGLFGKYPYRSVMVDNATAAWAGGIAAWLFIKKEKKGTFFLPALVLFVLPIFKRNIGLMLSIMILFFWFILYLINSEMGFREQIKDIWKDFFKKKKWMCLGFLILPFIGMIMYGVIIQADTVMVLGHQSISETINSSLVQPSDQAMLIIKNTAKAFLRGPVTTILTMPQILFAWICIIILVRFTIQDKLYKKQFTGMAALVLLGTFAYLSVLTYAYLNIFSAEEGTVAAGFDRYMGIYVIMGNILLLSSLFYDNAKEKIGTSFRYGILIVLALLSVSQLNEGFLQSATQYDIENYGRYSRVMKVRETAEKINQITNKDDQIYMIAQDYHGREFMVARYMMDGRVKLGNSPNRYIHNIVVPGTIKTDRQIEMTSEDFAERVLDGGYKYLWVFNSNEYFDTFAQDLFHESTIQENALYTIRHEGTLGVMFYLEEVY